MAITRHIPNAITCGNILCGCMAVLCAFDGKLLLAALFMLAGAIFDFFDGLMARLLGVQSPMGKELDSLADVITFGLAPGAMLFTSLHGLLGVLSWAGEATLPKLVLITLPYVGFAIVIFSALRLAKFNIDTRQTMGFIGLPTPANALFWGALLTSDFLVCGSRLYTACVYIALAVVMCALLVCELPMMAFKFKHWGWRGNAMRYSFAIVAVLLVGGMGLMGYGLAGISVLVLLYVLISALEWLLAKRTAQIDNTNLTR